MTDSPAARAHLAAPAPLHTLNITRFSSSTCEAPRRTSSSARSCVPSADLEAEGSKAGVAQATELVGVQEVGRTCERGKAAAAWKLETGEMKKKHVCSKAIAQTHKPFSPICEEERS